MNFAKVGLYPTPARMGVELRKGGLVPYPVPLLGRGMNFAKVGLYPTPARMGVELRKGGVAP